MALPGSNWTNPDIPAVFGAQVTEVDMSDAGMSVIRADGLLDERTVRWLEGLPKQQRSVEVGRLSRFRVGEGEGGKTLARAVTEGILYRVERMLTENGIGRDRIVSIKRDAVFITGPAPGKLRWSDGSSFRVKSTHSSYVKLARCELYCTPSRKRWTVKGIDDERAALHGPHVIDFAMEVLRLTERRDMVEAAATICEFRKDYVARQLPVGFYRELNAASCYCVTEGKMRFLVNSVDEAFPKENLEIAHNLRAVIVPLVGAIA